MSEQEFIVASRGSALALTQTREVVRLLEQAAPGARFRIRTFRTRGDALAHKPLPEIGGKGLFTEALEEALLRGDAHLAVHSMKDLPTERPPGLRVAATPPRRDPRDALVARNGGGLDALPAGAAVGSSSLRRRAQLLARRPDLRVLDLRGNVDTRLRKLRAGEFDAVVLAAAGLKRLGLWDDSMTALPADVMVPAPGQGALAVEAAADSPAAELAAAISDPAADACVRAERALLAALGGGCRAPIAGHATPNGNALRLVGLVAAVDGSRVVRDALTGPVDAPEALGERLAERLLSQGAREILAS